MTENFASEGDKVRARYVMIGGFLGAGKTTAVAQLARRWADQGRRVGLITNDQGSHLVDTAMLRSRGFATEEIPGGCFCCRFNSLLEASRALTHQTRPEVFLAEPVGSCTDLVATVTYPLRRMYGDDFTIAPLSVLVDPIRALRILGREAGGNFSDKVLYIYRKQLEEADLIVVSKSDLVDAGRIQSLRDALAEQYPSTPLLSVSAKTGAGMDEWFERLDNEEQSPRASMDVDYDVYAEGEARLGWLNATARITAFPPFDGNQFVESLAIEVRDRLNARGVEIAHFKMTLSPDEGLGDIAAAQLVRGDFVPELSFRLEGPVTTGELIVNLRAEGAPELLSECARSGLEATAAKFRGLQALFEHEENFRPGRPVPTHRIA